MSIESKPSFRTSWKNKLKKIPKPNITSYIQERILPNKTSIFISEKLQNLTDTAKQQWKIPEILNKTKSFLPGQKDTTNDTEKLPKGFMDSLFKPQTAQDVYIEVATICLWTLGMFCIIATIITMFIPNSNRKGDTSNKLKMIFFHIFLCEFFYLICILLSMINVAQDLQLNSVLCSFATNVMYVTFPVMNIALLLIGIQRLLKYMDREAIVAKLFSNTCVIQSILIFIWLSCFAIMIIVRFIEGYFSMDSLASKFKKVVPPSIGDLVNGISSKRYQCTIDGRLSSIFKIIFLILLIVIIILIIKSLVLSIFYGLLPLPCFKRKAKSTKHVDNHMTFVYFTFLLLNLCLSYPFYFISTGHSFYTKIFSQEKPFSNKVKISFLLRLSSIILQCLIFYTFDDDSWHLLRKLLYNCTCKKFSIFNEDFENQITDHKTKHDDSDKKNEHSRNNENGIDSGNNDQQTEDSTDNENGNDSENNDQQRKDSTNNENKTNHGNKNNRVENSPTKVSHNQSSDTQNRRVSTTISDLDDEVFGSPPQIESKIVTKSHQTRGTRRTSRRTANYKKEEKEHEETVELIEKPTSPNKSNPNKSNSSPNGNVTSKNSPTAKTSTDNNTHYHSIASSSPDRISAENAQSDNEIQPEKIHSTTEQKNISQKSPFRYPKYRQKSPMKPRSVKLRSTNHSSNRQTFKRSHSSKDTDHHHVKQEKQDRLSEILSNSTET